MGIIETIHASAANLTKADLLLIKYIKEKGLDACSAPISEIARSCGVSHATVTRFARKFGFDSLQAFKIALAQEIGPSDGLGHLIPVTISYSESSEDTARKLAQSVSLTINHTAQIIDHQRLHRITHMLINARRIFFIGKGNSGFAALDSAYKFNRIGLDARALTETHDMLMQSTMMTRKDVMVAFSNSGSTPEVIKAAELARAEQARVIAVSAEPDSNLCHQADDQLIYAIREACLDSGSIYSKIAVFFIIDLLYTEVCKQLGQQAIDTKHKTSQALRDVCDLTFYRGLFNPTPDARNHGVAEGISVPDKASNPAAATVPATGTCTAAATPAAVAATPADTVEAVVSGTKSENSAFLENTDAYHSEQHQNNAAASNTVTPGTSDQDSIQTTPTAPLANTASLASTAQLAQTAQSAPQARSEPPAPQVPKTDTATASISPSERSKNKNMSLTGKTTTHMLLLQSKTIPAVRSSHAGRPRNNVRTRKTAGFGRTLNHNS